MEKKMLWIIASLLWGNLWSAAAQTPRILPLRERAKVQDRWLSIRLERVLPDLMRRRQIDMWVIVSREYNEDPVSLTMLPATWLAARRRTILLFHDPGADEPIERLAVARYDIGDLFKKAWDPESQPDQWRRLAELIVQRDPRKIAVNYSQAFALADGISSSELKALREALPPQYRERIVSGERLAIGWLETRTAEEMEVYSSICAIAHQIIAEGLSAQAVQPGVTTTADLEWWYRERIAQLKLATWFHPSVSIQRRTENQSDDSFASRPQSMTIRRGDLLHVDFGIEYLGLHTDTQQHAYVLKAGEDDAPAGLKRALTMGNRLQDILTSNFVVGRSGNEILKTSLRLAKEEGLKPTIYTHPIGYHGHGAGPTIGLWDQQGGVPIRGDYPLQYDTAHSIELNVAQTVPEWDNQTVRIMLEEDAFFSRRGVRYIDGRQTRLLLIR